MADSNARILLAEDDETLQFLVVLQLAKLGYKTVRMVSNGLMAVECALQEAPFDVILMDVMMPVLDGLVATQRIREAQAESGIRTPIVGMTAFADIKVCIDAGMDRYLQKPVMLKPLGQMLNEFLPGRRARDSTEGFVDATLYKRETTQFVETDLKLKAINDKIDQLRKQFGLRE